MRYCWDRLAQWEWGQNENLQDSWGSDTNRLGRGISGLSYPRKSVDSQALNEGDATGRKGDSLFASLCPSPLRGPLAVPHTHDPLLAAWI